MRYYGRVIGLLVFLVCLALPNTSEAAIDAMVVTGDPLNGSGCTVPASKTAFSVTDQAVFSWVYVTHGLIGDVVEWDWFAPDQSLYSVEKTSLTGLLTLNGDGCAWGWITINGRPNYAASRPGTWTVNVLYNGSLVASGSFTIGTPPLSGQPPSIGFSLVSNSTIAAGQLFDFNIIVDFGPTMQFTGGSISLDGVDLTGPFMAALNSGFIRLTANGSVLTATVPWQSLSSEQHTVVVQVSSPGGTGTAQWTVTPVN
jgi:hypothetical protein